MLSKSHVLVGQVMIWLEKCLRDYVFGAAAEHEVKEPFSRLVEIASKNQTLIYSGLGGPQGYRIQVHIVFLRIIGTGTVLLGP